MPEVRTFIGGQNLNSVMPVDSTPLSETEESGNLDASLRHTRRSRQRVLRKCGPSRRKERNPIKSVPSPSGKAESPGVEATIEDAVRKAQSQATSKEDTGTD